MASSMLGRVTMAAAVWAAMVSPGSAGSCSRGDFEAAVSDAAQALRELNQVNKPTFQSKLRQLKAKRGWSHDQFLAEAAPIVQDRKIAEYDDEAAGFLARIEQLGAEGTSAAAPDCSRLAEVRQAMADLVAVQKAKWAYMFERISAELER